MARARLPLALLAAALVLSACGGSGGGSTPSISVGAAKTFALDGFQPAGNLTADTPTTMSFRIDQPSGQPLTEYTTGNGPHTGVHLILVNQALSELVHLHPPIAADGTVSTKVTLPSPGVWRVLVDAYATLPGQPPNFQLHRDIDVSGGSAAPAAPATFVPTVTTDGVTFQVLDPPQVKNSEAASLRVKVTDANGKPATFTPWFGALAHAIFFQEGTFSYFHTHVCPPADKVCAGTSAAVGSSPKPGELDVGVLLPGAGTWRMFLQAMVDGKVVTAPFTLVAS
jgi:hypothetical protein